VAHRQANAMFLSARRKRQADPSIAGNAPSQGQGWSVSGPSNFKARSQTTGDWPEARRNSSARAFGPHEEAAKRTSRPRGTRGLPNHVDRTGPGDGLRVPGSCNVGRAIPFDRPQGNWKVVPCGLGVFRRARRLQLDTYWTGESPEITDYSLFLLAPPYRVEPTTYRSGAGRSTWI
jgi:hypothetical protein